MAGSRVACAVVAAVAGCAAPIVAEPGVKLLVVPRPDLANTLDLDVTLDAPAPITVACTAARAGVDDDVLVYTSTTALQHTIAMRGLLADTTYRCDLTTRGPSPHVFPFVAVTDPLPDDVPSVTAYNPDDTSTGPPFVLLGHDRHCVGGPQRLVVYDLDGNVRWYDDGLPSLDIAFDAGYLGDGVFSYGGGWHDTAPPGLRSVDHDDLYVVGSPIARAHTFHHDGRRLPDGRFLVLMHETLVDPLGGPTFGGFSVGLVDPETDTDTLFWSAQRAVDAGDLEAGGDDPYHANWADFQPANQLGPHGDRLYVSMCKLGEVFAIDAVTGEVAWAFGEARNDFTVLDPSGAPIDEALALPQCQHGLEVTPIPGGVELLMYDNGAHGRGYSRVVAYALDEEARTATLTWTWTEPDWMEWAWGDVDVLPDDHVSVTMGHSCGSPYPDHHSAVVEVDRDTGRVPWRLTFTDRYDAIYRSERIDACDVFPIARYCPWAAGR